MKMVEEEKNKARMQPENGAAPGIPAAMNQTMFHRGKRSEAAQTSLSAAENERMKRECLECLAKCLAESRQKRADGSTGSQWLPPTVKQTSLTTDQREIQ